MSSQPLGQVPELPPLPGYRSLLLAVDSSDHSNRASDEALALAGYWDARVTGVHVYAAKLHDNRFRQMEGGLPERYREEQELERQRDVHDDLITRGLSIISDSYLDQVDRQCQRDGLAFTRRALEGKNYRELVREANDGEYDLLVLGALGLGAVPGSRLGTVCQRVARRVALDTLVVKQPQRSLADGPIVVAVDGSEKAYGGLLTALALAGRWEVPVTVIAAFDPYYHYVAFNRIAGVLSEEAGKVFRFQEQEQLHEEVIDSGLARIYQGHLDIATKIAADYGVEITTRLLDGKPYDAIAKYVHDARPSLLVLGRTGIHADAELDIGGNTEHLMQAVDCAVLLSAREHRPDIERVAETTTAWTREAELRMERVPEFVRNMARMAILRYAQERGHTVITESIVEEATARLMPHQAEGAMAEIVAAHDAGEISGGEVLRWAPEATVLLRGIDDLALRGNASLRAEKRARTAGATRVEPEHLQPFLEQDVPCADVGSEASEVVQATPSLHWTAAALARLARVPQGMMRDTSRTRIEARVEAAGGSEVTLDDVEAGLAAARQAMEQTMAQRGSVPPAMEAGTCPFAAVVDESSEAAGALPWSATAEARLQTLPEGMSRDMTRRAVDAIATRNGLAEVDEGFVEEILVTFRAGSSAVEETLPWEASARARIERAPPMVRGMLIREIESWAGRNGIDRIDEAAVARVVELWRDSGLFHLAPDDPRNPG